MHRKSSDKPLTPRHAWQPFTPRGVAAFAHATFGRLLFVQLLVTLLVAGAVVAFLRGAWFPVITQAMEKLPATGSIRNGELFFPGESPTRLAENARLAIVVDVAHAHTGGAGGISDVEVTFEKKRVAICGALGCWWQPYERGYVVGFNRPEVEPAWGAWRWPIIALAIIATVASLFVMWWTVALVYWPLTMLIAFFSDRELSWAGGWRLSAAALLPGACLVAVGLLLHGLGALDLFRFALLFALHVAAGLAFVFTSPFFLPNVAPACRSKNPFADRPGRDRNAPGTNPSSGGDGA